MSFFHFLDHDEETILHITAFRKSECGSWKKSSKYIYVWIYEPSINFWVIRQDPAWSIASFFSLIISFMSAMYHCLFKTIKKIWEGSLIVDTWHQFLIIEILGRFLHFLLAFSIESEMIEVLQIYRWSTLIPRFGTILINKLLKIFPIWYSFLISWWFSFRVIRIFHLILLEKSGFKLPKNFLLTLRFLTFRFS